MKDKKYWPHRKEELLKNNASYPVKEGSASLLTIEATLHCCGRVADMQVMKVLYVNAAELSQILHYCLEVKECFLTDNITNTKLL